MNNVTTNQLCVIRTKGGLEGLTTAVGVPVVLVRRDEDLLAIDEHKLVMQQTSPESLDLTDPCVCTTVGRGAVDRVHLDPQTGELVWPNGTQMRRAALDASRVHRSISLPAVPGRVVQIVPTRDQGAMALVRQDDGECDLLTEQVALFDSESGWLNVVGEIKSNAPLWAEWCDPAKAFLVFDAVGERLWQVSLSRRELPLQLIDAGGAGGPIQSVGLHPSGRWMALLLGETDEVPCRLVIGEISDRQVRWQAPFALPAGLIRLVCWHPTERLVAFDRGVRKKGFITVVNARGAVIQECPLPAGWFSHSLAFSSCGRRVFVASAHSIGVWTL